MLNISKTVQITHTVTIIDEYSCRILLPVTIHDDPRSSFQEHSDEVTDACDIISNSAI